MNEQNTSEHWQITKEMPDSKKRGKKYRLAVHMLLSSFPLHLGMVNSHMAEEMKWKNVTEKIIQLLLPNSQTGTGNQSFTSGRAQIIAEQYNGQKRARSCYCNCSF